MFARIFFFLVFCIWSVAADTDDLDDRHHLDITNNDVSHFCDELDSDSNSLEESKPITKMDGRSRRLKRSSWSLPPNTSVRYVLDWITFPTPLNNTFTFLLYDVVFRFILPTYRSLQTLYQTLGKLNDDKEDVIDLEFFEEQRANDERRTVYQEAEGLLNA